MVKQAGLPRGITVGGTGGPRTPSDENKLWKMPKSLTPFSAVATVGGDSSSWWLASSDKSTVTELLGNQRVAKRPAQRLVFPSSMPSTNRFTNPSCFV